MEEQISVAETTNFFLTISSSTTAVILIFGSITFACVSLGAKSFLLGDSIPFKTAVAVSTLSPSALKRVRPLNISFLSIYTVLHQLTLLGFVLLLSFIAENHPPFPHSDISEFDSDNLFFLIIVVSLIGIFTASSNYTLNSNRNKKENKIGHENNINATSTVLVSETPQAKISENIDKDLNQESPESSVVEETRNKKMDTIVLDEDIFKPMSSKGIQQEQARLLEKQQLERNKKERPIQQANSSNDILNMNQTQEWKGWMILFFLIYQYTNAGRKYTMSSAIIEDISSDVVEIVNLGRVLPASFLFLSGYSHFTYFYTKQDYSTARVLRVIFRLNFLSFLLCLTHANPYILYYVCPVHSYFFLLIFAIMKFKAKEWNYNRWKLRVKLTFLALLIFAIWDMDLGLFKLLHLPFFTVGPMGMRGAPLGPLWEWYFRTGLDHWAPYFGLLFAANLPITSLLQRKLESSLPIQMIISKGLIGMALGGFIAFWVNGPVSTGTIYQYSRSHPYFAVLAVLGYVYFRNCIPSLRNYSMDLFFWAGEATLETFLLHHHLFLTSHGNSKTILTLIPGWPKCNMLFVAILFFFIARRVHTITMFLRESLIPAEDETTAGKVLGAICLLSASSYSLSATLLRLNFLSPGIVILICIFCGALLYQTITDMTWKDYYYDVLYGNSKSRPSDYSVASSRIGKRDDYSVASSRRGKREDYSVASSRRGGRDDATHASRKSKRDDATNASSYYSDEYESEDDEFSTIDEEMDDSNTAVVKIVPPMIGILVILLLGLGWKSLYIRGAGNITRLPPNCEVYANEGQWFPVDVCNSYQRGIAFRQYGVTGGFDSYCEQNSDTPVKAWGWFDNEPASLCRFSTRHSRNMKSELSDRNYIFIGDGMVKNLFHSFCRVLLDDKTAGFDASAPKHTDITKFFETTKVEYKWAPLAVDQLEKLKEIRKNGDADGGASSPAIIIIGGGAWDRLHVWATDEDQESLRSTINKLSSEISNFNMNLGVPVVWMKPTAVHTNALHQEEKRLQMSEEALEEMRTLYKSWGVDDAASFILDGRAFTMQRVQESFDGIHYPPEVYDAGVQILANSMDWLVPPNLNSFKVKTAPPEAGVISNPSLGLMMICFALIGLFFFDGYLGFSYLASLIVNGVMPNELYEEAYWSIHRRWKLPLSSNSSGGMPWVDNLLHGQRHRRRENGLGVPSTVGTDLELVEELRSR